MNEQIIGITFNFYLFTYLKKERERKREESQTRKRIVIIRKNQLISIIYLVFKCANQINSNLRIETTLFDWFSRFIFFILRDFRFSSVFLFLFYFFYNY